MPLCEAPSSPRRSVLRSAFIKIRHRRSSHGANPSSIAHLRQALDEYRSAQEERRNNACLNHKDDNYAEAPASTYETVLVFGASTTLIASPRSSNKNNNDYDDDSLAVRGTLWARLRKKRQRGVHCRQPTFDNLDLTFSSIRTSSRDPDAVSLSPGPATSPTNTIQVSSPTASTTTTTTTTRTKPRPRAFSNMATEAKRGKNEGAPLRGSLPTTTAAAATPSPRSPSPPQQPALSPISSSPRCTKGQPGLQQGTLTTTELGLVQQRNDEKDGDINDTSSSSSNTYYYNYNYCYQELRDDTENDDDDEGEQEEDEDEEGDDIDICAQTDGLTIEKVMTTKGAARHTRGLSISLDFAPTTITTTTSSAAEHLGPSSKSARSLISASASVGTHSSAKKFTCDVDRNRKMSTFQTNPFHLAVESGDLEAVDMFIANKVDINMRDPHDEHFTALHKAAMRNNIEMIKKLIAAKAKIDAPNSGGLTPLHVAVICNNQAAVQVLASNKCNMNARDHYGNTPLLLCLRRKKPKISKEADAEMGCSSHVNLDIAEDLLLFKSDIDHARYDGRTCMHAACESGNLKVVKFLVTHGARLNIRDSFGFTPLLLAVHCNRIEVVKYILNHENMCSSSPNNQGIDFASLIKACDDTGNNIFHLVASSRNEGMITAILECVREQMSKNNPRDKSLLNLLVNDKEKLMKSTPLHIAVAMAITRRGEDELDDELKSDMGTSFECSLGVIKFLIGLGADVNAQQNEGDTPLHIVVRHITKHLQSKTSFCLNQALTDGASSCGGVTPENSPRPHSRPRHSRSQNSNSTSTKLEIVNAKETAFAFVIARELCLAGAKLDIKNNAKESVKLMLRRKRISGKMFTRMMKI